MEDRRPRRVEGVGGQGSVQQQERLTSFQYLNDEDDSGEPSSTFGGVGDFFSKVKSAFASSAATSTAAPTPAEPSIADGESIAASSAHGIGAQVASVSGSQGSKSGSKRDHPLLGSKTGNGNSEAGSRSDAPSWGAAVSVTTAHAQRSQDPRSSSGATHRKMPSAALGGIGRSRPSLIGSASTSITPAVAVNSKLPHATDAGAPIDDSVSTLADSPSFPDHPRGEALSEDEEDEGDRLGSLHRDSNRSSGYGLGLHRTSSINSLQDSPTAGGFWGSTSIPGFPLPREILADDTRSVHSSSGASSKYRRSMRQDHDDWYEPAGGRSTPTSAAITGLQTSADAIWRKIRGEGLSKKFWMADESVKECRDCLSPFTAFRRKHHCRLCGQIYCGWCASHIIPGARFGHPEVVRVCNFCMRTLEEYDAEESAAVIPHSDPVDHYAGRRLGKQHSTKIGMRVLPGMISAPLEAQINAPQSQFAANHLFARSNVKSSNGITHEAVATLLREHKIAQQPRKAARVVEDIIEADSRASVSPRLEPEGNVPSVGEAVQAPFRKTLHDEPSPSFDTEDPTLDSPNIDSDGIAPEEPTEPISREAKTPRPSLAAQAALSHAMNVLFPDESPADRVMDPPAPEHDISALYQTDTNQHPRVQLAADAAGYSRLRFARKEPSFSGGNFQAAPHSASRTAGLGEQSLAHLHTMARQTLRQSKVNNLDVWIDILITLALKTIDRVRPNAKAGDNIDVRDHVKIKRVPGGAPEQTQYVDGFVCSKHVATKRMADNLPLTNARVMVISFPLEYERPDSQFVSLEPVMAQEQEYIRLLVARITALRPQLLVVEKTASRYAIDLLEAAGIMVVWSLKRSAMEAISRCTQADIITSVDRLALEPRLGRVATFDVQTYKLIGTPDRSKCLMRFEGLHHNVGCTILLRGAGPETLRRIKVILELLIFLAYNLRLEECLMRDEDASLAVGEAPPRDSCAVLRSAKLLPTAKQQKGMLEQEAKCIEGAGLSKSTQDILHMYDDILISVSAAVKIPPPFPLAKMRLTADRLAELKKAFDDEEVAQIKAEEERSKAALTPTAEKTAEEADLGTSPEVQPTAPADVNTSKSRTKDLVAVLHKPEEIQRLVGFVQEQRKFKIQLRDWQQYLSRCPDAIHPLAHQRIVMLASLISTATNRPCSGPYLHQVEFFGYGDETLGHFIERQCDEALLKCRSQACDKDNWQHYQVFVHNAIRVQVSTERFVCPRPGDEQHVLVWRYCKKCGITTDVTRISDETWSYSLAKFLELHFYAADSYTTASCSHHFREHVRFFAYRNFAVRFLADLVEVLEVAVPDLRLSNRPDIRCKMKNEEAIKLQKKSHAYWDSVVARLNALSRELVLERDSAVREVGQATLTDLKAKCLSEKAEIDAALVKCYSQSAATVLLPLNTVACQLQDKVGLWDGTFVDFERTFLPYERDSRRITASHLKRLFQERDGAEKAMDNGPRLATPAELDEMQGTSTDASEKERPMLTSISTTAQSAQTPTSSSLDTKDEAPATTSISTRGAAAQAGSPPDESMTSASGTEELWGFRTPAKEISAPNFEESSCTENEGGRVHGMVRRFERPTIAPTSSAVDDSAMPRVRKPVLRREKTDDAVRTVVTTRNPQSTFHDLGQSEAEETKTPSASQAFSNPLQRSESRSKVPRPQPLQRGSSASKKLELDKSNRSGPPPSSYRPPRAGTLRNVGAQPSPARGLSSTARAPIKNRKEAETIGQRSRRSSGASQVTQNNNGEARATQNRSRIPSMSRRNDSKSKVTTLARYYDGIGRLAERDERERQRQAVAARARRARPVAVTQTKVQVFRTVRDAVKDDDESDSSSDSGSSKAGDAEDEDDGDEASEGTAGKGHVDHRNQTVQAQESASLLQAEEESTFRALKSAVIDVLSPPQGSENADLADQTQQSQSSFSQIGSIQPILSDPDVSASERGSLLKAISGFWAGRGAEAVPALEYPMLSTEHVFADSNIIIREDEPSSIIAFTLSSKDYHEKLHSLQQSSATTGPGEGDESFMPDDSAISEAWRIVDAPPAGSASDLEAAMKRPGSTHFKFEFSSGSARIWCRILFAEQFDALRRSCGCSESFIESLSRCVKWDSSGGKSGAAFLKTRDDRFIVKQLSRSEADSFSKFAPHYFDYMADCFYRDRPTTLAKILGYFRIGFKNPNTGRTLKFDCLVMEHLFYGRTMKQIFDLKGSMRNRLVQTHDNANQNEVQVLQDENLVELAQSNPLFVREHSKRLIRAALWNDSLFLADMNVMDYSLVVGIDKNKPELVVGIIDFVRTFTWDKRVESFVKEAGLLGGTGRGEPTIITPRQYRNRFLGFLDRSFLMSPDAWLPSSWAHQ